LASNGISKLVFTILSAVAEAERERTRERIREVKSDQRIRGRYLGGSKPFGWRLGDDGALIPDAAEQAAIGRMMELRREGRSLRAIADIIKAKGFVLSHVGVGKVLAAAAQGRHKEQAA
jgi:DNA invertase Pin-like site-specific DNA recombinase